MLETLKQKLNMDKEMQRMVMRLAWPVIIEQLLGTLLAVVATMLMKPVGPAAVAGTGLIGTLLLLIQAIFAALSTGTTVLVARLIGEGSPQKATRAVGQSMLMAIVCSLLIGTLCFVFANQVVDIFFGATDKLVLEYAKRFFVYVALGLPFMLITIVGGGALRGAGQMRAPTIVAVLTNIVNVSLALWFIYGLNMGIDGVGLALLIARIVGALATLYVLYLGKTTLRQSVSDLVHFDGELMGRTLKVGLPAALEQLVMQGGFLAAQMFVLSHMPGADIAAYHITISVNTLMQMPVMGMAITTVALVGQNLGAGKPEVAQKVTTTTIKMSVIATGILSLLVAVFARHAANIYTADEEVITLASVAIPLFASCGPVIAFINMLASALRAGGDIYYVMWSGVAGIWLGRLGMALVFVFVLGLGLPGVFYAMMIDFYVRAVLYYLRYKKGKWKTIKV